MTSDKPQPAADAPEAGEPGAAGEPAVAPRQRWNAHLAEDRPGDPVCLLYRVCPGCGSVMDTDPPTTCPECHLDIAATP
jgi:hypothetical protein